MFNIYLSYNNYVGKPGASPVPSLPSYQKPQPTYQKPSAAYPGSPGNYIIIFNIILIVVIVLKYRFLLLYKYYSFFIYIHILITNNIF